MQWVPSFAKAVGQRAEGAEGEAEIGGARSALEFLQAVYRSPAHPLAVRIRCAVEALPYENPKLSAVAVASFSGEDFASRLDRAIERGEPRRLIEDRCSKG